MLSYGFSHSNRLLTSGWWAYSRKPNYVADWIQSLTWGLVIGTASPIPYFYSIFFIVVLIHRCGRDFERYVLIPPLAKTNVLTRANRCGVKYGKDWERYCSVVKYKFIPFVY
jgi:delta24(24(1))-sterol reductase